MAKRKLQRTAVKIFYDGTPFFGWQRQKKDISIQSTIEDVLEKIFCRHTTVHGSGRTDAGVHALGQVAHFNRPAEFEKGKLISALNSLLPPEVKIQKIADADSDFHSRFSAVAKKYLYIINTNLVQSPFFNKYSLHVNRSIKTELISKALNILEGENDFRHFTTPNAIGKTSKRNIMRTSLTEDNSFIYISITANGFLRYMVRSIIGTIIQLSQEKTTIDHFESSLSGEKSDPLPITLKAKPHGLYLVKVYYNENPFKEGIELQNGILNWQFLKESKIWEY